MKFKRLMSAIYSSALVLGLSFLLYPQVKNTTPDKGTVNSVVTPTAALSPTPSVTVSVSTKVTQAVSNTVTSPTPSATLEPGNEIPELLTNNTLTTPLSGVSEVVTAYINAYYKNDFETISSLVTDIGMLNTSHIEANSKNVARVEDITLYAKPGIEGVFSIVYATYSLYYSDLHISVPQFSEYYVKRLSDGTFKIITTPVSEKARQAFAQARQSEVVVELSISTLIKRYHTACLSANERLLRGCVTDASYLDLNYITSRYSVTESFSDYEFLLYPGINEFDYIVFVTHSEKIVFSGTPAPCIEYYYIDLDASFGNPAIYLGITSLETDAFCKAVLQSSEIQALAREIDQKMEEAARSDDDLLEFYQLLQSNSAQ